MDREKMMRALRNAHNAGDEVAARRIANMLKSQGQQQPAEPEQSFGEMIYENVVGRGEVDTPGERFGQQVGRVVSDIGQAARTGAAIGATAVADLPALVGQLGQAGVVKAYKAITGEDPPPEFLRELSPELPLGIDPTRAYAGEAARAVAPNVMGFEPETRAGKFTKTGAEFATGAALTGGAGSAVRYGLLPGLASEAAGQATEGTAAEPYARTAAALGTSLAATPRPGRFAGTDERARMANKMIDEGVDVTAGQARQSPGLMRLEGRLEPTARQLDDFTASTMRQLGSAAEKATPEALRKVGDTIVKNMDDAVAGVSIQPARRTAAAARKIASDYAQRVPQANLTPRLRGIANEIRTLAQSNKPVSASRLKTWRSDIGKLTVSNDAPTREAAHSLRRLIDEMTDEALTAAGRGDDIAKLAQNREAYRNFIGVRDAASRAGAEAGDLSPTQLNQSVIRSQGRENYATGRTTGMADFARSGAATLRQAPTVSAGGQRTITEFLPAGTGAGAGYLASLAGAGPVGVGAAAAFGAGAPALGQSLMRSNVAQTLMRDPARGALQSYPVLPGLLSQD